MSIDTNKPYEVPEKYKAKKVGEPKMKASAKIMIFLGWLLVTAATVAVIWGAVFGISKLVENIQKSSEPETSIEENVA